MLVLVLHYSSYGFVDGCGYDVVMVAMVVDVVVVVALIMMEANKRS